MLNEEINEYIKTKSGVWRIKRSDTADKYFECSIEGMTFTIFEGSKFWDENKTSISKDLISLGDVLVVVQPDDKTTAEDINLLRDENNIKEYLKNIRKGYHYYLSAWDDRSNLKKFAELTTKGVCYLF